MSAHHNRVGVADASAKSLRAFGVHFNSTANQVIAGTEAGGLSGDMAGFTLRFVNAPIHVGGERVASVIQGKEWSVTMEAHTPAEINIATSAFDLGVEAARHQTEEQARQHRRRPRVQTGANLPEFTIEKHDGMIPLIGDKFDAHFSADTNTLTVNRWASTTALAQACFNTGRIAGRNDRRRTRASRRGTFTVLNPEDAIDAEQRQIGIGDTVCTTYLYDGAQHGGKVVSITGSLIVYQHDDGAYFPVNSDDVVVTYTAGGKSTGANHPELERPPEWDARDKDTQGADSDVD